MPQTQKLKVRLISPWTKRVETETALFSTHISTAEADALLCEWAPDPELLTFRKRKAWYCCEPACRFTDLQGGTWPDMKEQLAPWEFLWHGHPDIRFRVPHITHFETLVMDRQPDRLKKAIAIVSNHGGQPWKRQRDVAYRNRMIMQPAVDLFGRSGWNKYREHWYSWPEKPANYRGEIPGDWSAGEKRNLLARYQVSVCLENMNEPLYFTEKFVEAAIAGCVPVYRAHETVRELFLQGANWIDPADYGHSAEQTLSTALAANATDVMRTNQAWLQNSLELQSSSVQAVFDRIGRILAVSPE